MESEISRLHERLFWPLRHFSVSLFYNINYIEWNYSISTNLHHFTSVSHSTLHLPIQQTVLNLGLFATDEA